jgi:AAA+ ATPase superfamily predicted ATPase
MEHIFLDREEELKFLEERFRKGRPELIVLYGRRRIGKTSLIKKFIEGKKAIYYLATKEREEKQAKDISQILSAFFKDKTLEINPFTSYSQIFSYLYEKSKEERLIFVIDEFGYLLEASPYISSVLQKFWDEYFSNSKIFIILCGSTIGMMESLLSQRNPLYGRRTGQWKLEALDFKALREFLKEKSFEDVLKCWFITDGILFYAKEFKEFESFEKFLLNTFFNKGHIFYEEGRILISEELGEVPTYFSILSFLSKGASRQIEIANNIGMKPTSLTRYLETLIRLRFIKKEPLITKEKSKKVYYSMNDNFLHFWFRFVYPNRQFVEKNEKEKIKEILERDLNAFFGEKFEEFVRSNIGKFFENVEKVGKWRGFSENRKVEEIDIVGINEKEKTIVFGECKWGENVDAEKVFKELKEKSKLVDWNRNQRKEIFAVFAKSFEKKIKEENLYLFDLKDIENLLQ